MLDVRAGGLICCGCLCFEAIGCGLAGEGDGKGDGLLAGFFRGASVFFAGAGGAGSAVLVCCWDVCGVGEGHGEEAEDCKLRTGN